MPLGQRHLFFILLHWTELFTSEQGTGEFMPFIQKSIGEIRPWCWMTGTGLETLFLFSQMVFEGVEVRSLFGTVKFSYTRLTQ